MKQNFRTLQKTSLYFLFLFTLLLTSCEKDNYTENKVGDDSPSQTLKYDDFLKELNQFKIVNNPLTKDIFYTKQSEEKNKNQVQTSLTVNVNRNQVTRINRSNNLITYIFDATTNQYEARNHFYKLILIKQDEKYDLKLLKFLPNVIDQNARNSKFKGTIVNIPLITNTSSRECITVTTTQDVFVGCANHNGQMTPGNGCWGGHWETIVTTQLNCTGGGGTSGFPNTGANPWQEPVAVGGTYTPYTGPYPINTYSEIELEDMFNNFISSELNPQQQQFLMLNPHLKDEIKLYLVDNLDYEGDFNDESKAYVKFAIEKIRNGAKVDFKKKVISHTSFVGTKSECISKKLNTNPNSFYSQMLSKFNSSTNLNLTLKVGNTQNGEWGITKGTQNVPNNYEITINQNVENGSNLMKTVTLCHELIHAYMYSTLESEGLLNFDINGDALLNISCIQNTNYNAVNLNTLSTKDRFQALFCAMNQNGTLTAQWTHNLFNTTNFNLTTYRQALEDMIYNDHDWNNEDTVFKNTAINTFGTNWKREIAKGVSWIGLESTSEYQTYFNSYSTSVSKTLYLSDFRHNISVAKNTCP